MAGGSSPQNAVAAIPFTSVSPWPSVAGYPSVSPVASIGASKIVWALPGVAGNDPAYSLDNGDNWQTTLAPAGGTVNAAAWNGRYWVAVGQGGLVWINPGGLFWEQVVTGIVANWYSIAWSESLQLWLASGFGGPPSGMTSPDGRNWTVAVFPVGISSENFPWNGSRFIAAADDFPGTGQALVSLDGIVFTAHPRPPSNPAPDRGFTRVGACDPAGLFLSLASNGTDSLTTPDGVAWTVHAGATVMQDWRSLIHAKNSWLAVPSGASFYGLSLNGINWTYPLPIPNTDVPQKGLCFNGVYALNIAVDPITGDTVLQRSTDFVTWARGGALPNPATCFYNVLVSDNL